MTGTPMDAIRHAETLMSEHDIRNLPVIQGRALVGVTTDCDICSIRPDALVVEREARTMARQPSIGAVLSAESVTLSPHDDRQTAAAAFIDETFGGFSVVDNDAGRLGIVTHIDLLRCLLAEIYYFAPVPWHLYLFACHGTVILLVFEEVKKYYRRKGSPLEFLG